MRMPSDREPAAHCPQFTVEPKLANEHQSVDAFCRQLSGGDQNSNGDRQIERCAVFPNVSRSEINRNSTWRNFESRINQRRAHALSAFFHRTRGETNDRPLWQALGCVDL